MQIRRATDRKRLLKLMNVFPVAAILGPRQCGKTTLARSFESEAYFDLENPRDLAKLQNPQLVLEQQKGLIVIDEVQRAPDLFPLLRFLVDNKPEQRYLILGSASRDLIRQSSESLAGRIGYFHLSGFQPEDVEDLSQLWLRGGMPPAYLAGSDENAFLWIEQYVATFLERDIPQLGINIPAPTLRRFWTMISHYNGQLLNYSELARSFGISDGTCRRYLEILEGTFVVRQLQPWYVNISKRIVKAPKLYIRDSGIFHSFMGIPDSSRLLGHPKLGASFESFALEAVCRSIGKPDNQFYFWRTHTGAELDLFWQDGGRNWGVEFKYTDAPRRTRSMTTVLEDLELEHIWIVYPGRDSYPVADRLSALPLSAVRGDWRYH